MIPRNGYDKAAREKAQRQRFNAQVHDANAQHVQFALNDFERALRSMKQARDHHLIVQCGTALDAVIHGLEGIIVMHKLALNPQWSPHQDNTGTERG